MTKTGSFSILPKSKRCFVGHSGLIRARCLTHPDQPLGSGIYGKDICNTCQRGQRFKSKDLINQIGKLSDIHKQASVMAYGLKFRFFSQERHGLYMKIIHLCLNCFYIEGLEYQENVLPRKHKQLGHDVYIISSTFSFTSDGKRADRDVGEYYNSDGIQVTILPYKSENKYTIAFGLYANLLETIEQIAPDIIFVHGIHFLSMLDVVAYKKDNVNVKIFVDHHTDFINAPIRSWKERLITFGFWRFFVQRIARHVEYFWGVTPLRVQYLRDVYKLPWSKVGLLIMGGDESKINFEDQSEIRNYLRTKFGISISDFLIVTGGKIDRLKNIHLLMKAVAELTSMNIHLVVFGQANDEMIPEIDFLSQDEKITNIGWIPSDQAYDWFLTSELAVFPGTHSVLWEQAVACGIPCVFKYWEGMTHVDVGGNCKFLYQDSVEEIKETILEIANNQKQYEQMKTIAINKGIPQFSYLEIAKKSLVNYPEGDRF